MTKEQKETVAFIFILTAIVVSACIMLIVRPKLKDAAEDKETLKKITADLDKERAQSKQLLEFTEKEDRLRALINDNEAGLFGGITVGDLSKVVNTIVKSRFQNLKLDYLGDRAELLPGGRYNELVNELQLKNCDFHEAVRFVCAIETSNPGIRITNMEIDSAGVQSSPPGTVAMGLEVKMMGMHQGDGVDAGWRPEADIAYQPGNRRNPFGKSGVNLIVDPDQVFRERVYGIKVTMNTGDSLWIKDMTQDRRGARECMLKRYMPIFEPAKIRLTKISEDYFTVRRDDGKQFKLIIRQYNEMIHGEVRERGTIKELIEME
jgi:hypothetical protein